jgi:hypothetical protein
MRRRRARRRAGYRCLTIEIHDTEIDALVHRGLLGVDERDQEGAVIVALSDYIERTSRVAIVTDNAELRDAPRERRNSEFEYLMLARSVVQNRAHVLYFSQRNICSSALVRTLLRPLAGGGMKFVIVGGI